MTKTKRIILTALMISLGVLLPILVVQDQKIRSLLSLMHIAPLLAGLLMGPVEGLCTGLFSPLLSFLLTGMPMAPVLPGMIVELGAYGLISGLSMKMFKGKYRIYPSLIFAMILGRIVAGLVQAFILQPGNYSIGLWVSAYFLGTLPGMVIQLILLPILVKRLQSLL